MEYETYDTDLANEVYDSMDQERNAEKEKVIYI